MVDKIGNKIKLSDGLEIVGRHLKKTYLHSVK